MRNGNVIRKAAASIRQSRNLDLGELRLNSRIQSQRLFSKTTNPNIIANDKNFHFGNGDSLEVGMDRIADLPDIRPTGSGHFENRIPDFRLDILWLLDTGYFTQSRFLAQCLFVIRQSYSKN